MNIFLVFGFIKLIFSSAVFRKFPITRIVGGYEVSPKFEYPWMVSLQINNIHACGGTLYNEKTIITAAHCAVKNISDWIASLHRHDITKTVGFENGTNYKILDRIIHPKYKTDDKYSESHDASIWKINASGYIASNVEEPNHYQRSQSFVDLDQANLGNKAGTILKVIGWGYTKYEGDYSPVLLEVTVPVFDINKCKKLYSFLDASSQFCAAYPEGGKAACGGDSGGPVFTNENGKPTLVGIVSWGVICAKKGYPEAFTRVYHIRNFIKANAY